MNIQKSRGVDQRAAGSNRPVSVYTEKIFREYLSFVWGLPVFVCFSV